MATKEEKLVDQILNLSDDVWFNPAIIGRLLANQPFYNMDRVMEIVAYIIHNYTKKYGAMYESGKVCEGLILANELSDKLYDRTYNYNNLTLPKVEYSLEPLPPANKKAAAIKINPDPITKMEKINIIQ